MASPAVNIAQAAQAYQQLSQGGPAKGADPAGGDSFADLVQGALEQAREIGRRGEDMSLKGVTDRADVYGLGATLYHLIGGRIPYLVKNASDLVLMLGKEPDPLTSLRPDCPPALATLVHSMLNKTPARRPDAASVATALADLASR